MAAYNHADFVLAAMESVLTQTYTDFELVVVDDGSTDDTWQILCAIEERFPERVRLFRHTDCGNHGISATHNLALTCASGEIITWIGSDDAWHPCFLMKVVREIDANADEVLVYGRASHIDSLGKDIGRISGVTAADAMLNPVEKLVLFGSYIPAIAVAVHRTTLDRLGGFRELLVYSDWELWIRILSEHRAVFIPEVLARYRVHGGNTSVGIPAGVHFLRQLEVMDSLSSAATLVSGLLGAARTRGAVQLTAARSLWYLDRPREAAQRLEAAMETDPDLMRRAGWLVYWLDEVADEYGRGRDFRIWCLGELMKLGVAGLRAKCGQELAAGAFEARQQGNLDLGRRYGRACLRQDPRWFANTGLVRIAAGY